MWTRATSLTVTIEPFTTLIGRSFRSFTAVGEALSRIWYSVGPIFSVPVGRITFCALIALLTSIGVMPFSWRACGSRSTSTSRDSPP